MKKILLLAAVALVVSTAGAQMKNKTVCIAEGENPSTVVENRAKTSHSPTVAPVPATLHPQARRVRISEISTIQEKKMSDVFSPVSRVSKAPSRATTIRPYYRRPAGMFSSAVAAVDGVIFINNNPYFIAKPYAEYYWLGSAENASESTNYAWNLYSENSSTGVDRYIDYQSELYYSLPQNSWWMAPEFVAYGGRLDDDGVVSEMYQYCNLSKDNDNPGQTIKYQGIVTAADNNTTFTNLYNTMFGYSDGGVIPLCSSKTSVFSGRFGNQEPYLYTSYSGAEPWGDNENGWWFGKNASHIDGMGQAFEKPQHPYQLNHVYLLINEIVYNVQADVTMTCKVYKLADIPDYGEESVSLPEVPGELVCTGEALLTPTTAEETQGLITFTLYGDDGTEFAPIIDYPILVTIDGYNSPGMENLVDFHALVSLDDQVDEGYGELAYLKYGVTDEDGNFDHYIWAGLNNFFSTGTMMTGFTIFIDIDNPYITFTKEQEDGQYLFPAAGGYLQKTWLDGTSTSGLRFTTSCPSAGGDWRITCNGSETLPSWLNISLIDITNSTGFHGVRANVSATALPSGTAYREAIVRFEIPGDYIEYKFMQGTQPTGFRGDVNTDGKVNISDVTELINYLLSNSAAAGPHADVDADGKIGIADVTALIDHLLSGKDLVPLFAGNREFTVGGVTFKMMAVEGGTFAMGATRNQGNSTTAAEKPVHLVTLSDYCLGQTEVTQALWNAVMGSNPSNFTSDPNLPVEMVSWNDCQQFITKLNQMTGMTFRMPTEAEWEYAARGGKKTRGNRYAGSNTLDDVAWYNANAAGTTHPVGTKAPNELGIYDMSGNVYEYCSDFSDGNPYPSADHQYNPTGVLTGNGRIIRGGSIDYGSDNCRIARRWGDDANSRWKDQGLRLAL